MILADNKNRLSRKAHIRMQILLLLLSVVFVSCLKQSEQPAEITGAALGTTYSIKLFNSTSNPSISELHTGIMEVIADVDKTMSVFVENSEVSRFNRLSGTDWLTVSPALIQVISESLAISRASDGAFDVTIGNLIDLWGFGKTLKPDRVPSQQAIQSALQTSNYKKLLVSADQTAISKAIPDLAINLSAIAKGYAVDEIASFLESRGFDRFLVEIGGEVRTKGLKSKGKPWLVAIERPETDKRSIYKVIGLTDLSLATSGNYRNFFEIAGKRYSHIIDPETGRPVDNNISSVSVFHPSCMIADALATTLMVLGYEKGSQFAKERNYAVLWLLRTDDGLVERLSPAFDPKLIQ
jgi:thiamine biosynthesis lipoprotein